MDIWICYKNEKPPTFLKLEVFQLRFLLMNIRQTELRAFVKS